MRIAILKKRLVFNFVFVILLLIAGLRPVGLDADSLNYVSILTVHISDANFLDKEPFFWLINEFNNLFFSGKSVTFFLIFAFIGVFLKLSGIYRISKAPYFSLALYVFLYFILHEMTQIRVGIASGLFLLAIDDFYKKNVMQFFFKIAIACLFHYSAILGLLLIFLKRDSFNPRIYMCFLFLSCLSVFFPREEYLNLIIGILPEFLAYKLVLYKDLLKDDSFSEINIFNFYYFSLCVFSVFFILNTWRIRDNMDIFLLKIFILGVSAFFFLSFLPVLAFRVSEFFLVVSIIVFANLSFIFRQRLLYKTVIFAWGCLSFVFQGILKILNLEVLF